MRYLGQPPVLAARQFGESARGSTPASRALRLAVTDALGMVESDVEVARVEDRQSGGGPAEQLEAEMLLKLKGEWSSAPVTAMLRQRLHTRKFAQIMLRRVRARMLDLRPAAVRLPQAAELQIAVLGHLASDAFVKGVAQDDDDPSERRTRVRPRAGARANARGAADGIAAAAGPEDIEEEAVADYHWLHRSPLFQALAGGAAAALLLLVIMNCLSSNKGSRKSSSRRSGRGGGGHYMPVVQMDRGARGPALDLYGEYEMDAQRARGYTPRPPQDRHHRAPRPQQQRRVPPSPQQQRPQQQWQQPLPPPQPPQPPQPQQQQQQQQQQQRQQQQQPSRHEHLPRRRTSR
jgi:hypothetical protein